MTKKERQIKYVPQTRNLKKNEDRQRTFWFWVGVVPGLIIGLLIGLIF